MSVGELKPPLLKISNLTKRYGDFTAVKNLSLEVYKGEILGLLGPNGAGKTTTINMICGILKPDGGEISVSGKSIAKRAAAIRRMIGYCPQDIVIWDALSCIEQLEFMGMMYDLGRHEARARGLELLATLGLAGKRDKTAKTLSGGMQRRLNIALALVHEPRLLILDEPQAGLDPQSLVLVRDYIRQLAKQTTILLSTHDMDEAERLTSKVAIIDRGELLVLDTPENLKKRIGAGAILELTIDGGVEAEIAKAILQFPDGVDYQTNFSGKVLSIMPFENMAMLPQLLDTIRNQGITIKDIKIRQKNLEDVFISLTGRGIRE